MNIEKTYYVVDENNKGKDFLTEQGAKDFAEDNKGCVAYRFTPGEREDYWDGEGWYQASKP